MKIINVGELHTVSPPCFISNFIFIICAWTRFDFSQLTNSIDLVQFYSLTCSPGSMCTGKNLGSQFDTFRWHPPKQILVGKKNPKLMDRCQVRICQSDNNGIDFMTLSLEVPRS